MYLLKCRSIINSRLKYTCKVCGETSYQDTPLFYTYYIFAVLTLFLVVILSKILAKCKILAKYLIKSIVWQK